MPVHTVTKDLLVMHSAEQMFELVDKVEDYPKFLPWYGRTEIIERQGNELKARLHMDYMGIRQSFATHNCNSPPHEIRMQLIEGPFKSLHGSWRFTPIDSECCRIGFILHYEPDSLIGRLIQPVFGTVSSRLVEAFVREADKRHG